MANHQPALQTEFVSLQIKNMELTSENEMCKKQIDQLNAEICNLKKWIENMKNKWDSLVSMFNVLDNAIITEPAEAGGMEIAAIADDMESLDISNDFTGQQAQVQEVGIMQSLEESCSTSEM